MPEPRRAGSPSTSDEGTTDAYHVGHVALACFLWFKGHGMSSKQWKDGFCSWDFISSEELHSDVTAFFQGTATVDPRRYFARVTEFKQDMYKDKPQ